MTAISWVLFFPSLFLLLSPSSWLSFKFPWGAPAPWAWLGVRVPAATVLHQAFAPLLAKALHILLAVIAFQFSWEMLSPAEPVAARWPAAWMGPCSRRAAADLCAEPEPLSLLLKTFATITGCCLTQSDYSESGPIKHYSSPLHPNCLQASGEPFTMMAALNPLTDGSISVPPQQWRPHLSVSKQRKIWAFGSFSAPAPNMDF